MMGSIFSKKICGFKKLFRMRRRHFESREFRVSWENPPCPTEAVEKFRFDFSMRTHTCIGFAKKHMKSPPHPSPLPHGDCVAIRKPEPSFPRKRESSRNFIHDLSPLDARVRGHDELRHSLHGRGKGRGEGENFHSFPFIGEGWGDLKGIFWVSVFLFIFLGTLGAGSMKLGSDEIQLVGRIYVMGNEPFTVVALKLDDGEVYALLGEHDKELRGLQGRRVSVAGKPSEEKPRGAKAIIVKSFKILESK